ncbi:MAG: SIS domain-containing protein [Halanaerobiales bacterium]
MEKKLGKKSYKEMMNQDQAWNGVLADNKDYRRVANKIREENIKNVIFIGCGSSYYISLSAAAVFSGLTGIAGRAVPASELIFFPDSYLTEDSNLVVAISRSGESTEVVKAVTEVNKRSDVCTLAISCYEDSKLVQEGQHVLLASQGKEESVVMTRSFTSLLLGMQLFSALWVDNGEYINKLERLPGLFRNRIDKWEPKVERAVEKNSFEKYQFLGQGNLYGIANEAMLKMKEMALVPSEDFHSLEFRHGPKSTVDNNSLITMYMGQDTYKMEKRLVKEIINYGGRMLIICEQADEELKKMDQQIFELKSGLDQFVLAPLYLVVSQLYAYFTAIKKDINVDNPRNLTQVVEII